MTTNGDLSLADGAARDGYRVLLATSRGMRRDHAIAREAWLQGLEIDRKVDKLFELEMLLKGLLCFASPRNHPGPPLRGAIAAADFRAHAAIVREGLQRVVVLARALLRPEERGLPLPRHLEAPPPLAPARARSVRIGAPDESPGDALMTIARVANQVDVVIGGLEGAGRVPFRPLYAALGLLHREVARSPFFDPAYALEFRPEFDRIENADLVHAIRTLPGEEGQRLFALALLSILRLRRVLVLADVAAHGPAPSRSLLILAALRADSRALVRHLTVHAGKLLAASLERDIFSEGARMLASRVDLLRTHGEQMLDWRRSLDATASRLRLEVRRMFERELPAVVLTLRDDDLRARVGAARASLDPVLGSLVVHLAKTLGAPGDATTVLGDVERGRAASERQRRDAWMFAQIVRGFAAKAAVVRTPDRADKWTTVETFRFVRDFLVYFRTLGLPLLRGCDYPRVDKFLGALHTLADTDLLDPPRLTTALAECEALHLFLVDAVETIGKREELTGIAFDRRAAAESLKGYLGDTK